MNRAGWSCAARSSTRAARGVPWGISESAYNVVDRHDTYQYKAFGVPGLGLKRGLGDELVVAPYATALAAMIDAPRSAANLRRLAAAGLEGDYGFFDAIDYTAREADHHDDAAADAAGSGRRARSSAPTSPTTPGMTLVALANALLGDPMVRRFHADPRVQATELLLQERVPRHAPTIQPRPLDEMRVVAPPPSHAGAAVSFATHGVPARAVSVERQLRDGRHQRRRRQQLLPRPGGDQVATRPDARSRQPVRLPARRAERRRSGRPPIIRRPREPDDYLVEFRAEKATFRRHDDEIATQLDVAVSTEDDVEVRRLTVVNQSTRIREIDVTSYAEIVLASPADDLAHPAFGKLFLETEYLADSAALLCHRRPRDPREPARLGGARPEPRRPAAGAGRMGDRSRAIPRPRPGHRRPGGARRPRAVGHDRRRARPDPQPPPADPAGPGRVGAPLFRHRHRVGSRDGRGARAEVPRPERGVARLRARLHARAERPASPRHFQRRGAAVRASGVAGALRRRLAAGGARTRLPSNELGQAGLWPHGISGDLPILLVRVVGDDDVALVRQVLQAQEYWRLKGLSADVVILNEDPSSYLDEMHAQLTALLDNGPWRTWKHRSGGAYLLRGDLIGEGRARRCSRRSRGRSSAATAATCAPSSTSRIRSQTAPAVRRSRPLPRRSRRRRADRRPPIAPPPMTLTNGLGGFTDDGREPTRSSWRATRRRRCRGRTSSPTRISAPSSRRRASAHTWSENSRENRLTSFANDPVVDPDGRGAVHSRRRVGRRVVADARDR